MWLPGYVVIIRDRGPEVGAEKRKHLTRRILPLKRDSVWVELGVVRKSKVKSKNRIIDWVFQ